MGDDFIVRADGPFPVDIVGLRIDPNVADDDVRTFRIIGQSADTIFTEPGVSEVAAVGDVFRGVLRLESLSVTNGARLAIDDRVELLAADAALSLDGGRLRVRELILEQAPGVEIRHGHLDLEMLLGITTPSLPVRVVEGPMRARGPLRVG